MSPCHPIPYLPTTKLKNAWQARLRCHLTSVNAMQSLLPQTAGHPVALPIEGISLQEAFASTLPQTLLLAQPSPHRSAHALGQDLAPAPSLADVEEMRASFLDNA